MKNLRKSRKLKYGSVSLALTLLAIAAVIIANTIFSALSSGFGWYIDMSEHLIYGIGKECEDYIRSTILPMTEKSDPVTAGDKKIRILLCDEQKNLESVLSQKYILNSVLDLQKKFPDSIKVEHLNVWENPTLAKSYGVTSASDVVFVFGDRHTTLTEAQFYVTSAENTEEPSAYNAEKRIAAALLRICSPNTPMCYFTLNHGEGLDDAELMYLVADAGFNYSFIDLSVEDIPGDCSLLMTVDPASDLLNTGSVSEISEIQKLEKYMSEGGRYMVLSSSSSLASRFPNLEKFLGDWGATFERSTQDGVEDSYIVKDPSNSTSIEGYTFFGQCADNSTAQKIFGDMSKRLVFEDACAITAADGFTSDGRGGYSRGDRVFSPLLTSYATAEAWASGFIVDKANNGLFTLMSLTEQKCENGQTAYLFVGASVNFCKGSFLQSSVYGNGEALMRILNEISGQTSPLLLTARPLETPPIQDLTTKQANVTTVLLCSIPVTVIAFVGIFVLVRRKHA